MDESRLISVIIPAYNAKDYLRECLDSVCNQSYSNLEIICINDGSTDNTQQIMQDYAQQDPRITIISQQKIKDYQSQETMVLKERKENIFSF